MNDKVIHTQTHTGAEACRVFAVPRLRMTLTIDTLERSLGAIFCTRFKLCLSFTSRTVFVCIAVMRNVFKNRAIATSDQCIHF